MKDEFLISEYKSVRDEILFRQKTQQSLLSSIIVVLGLLAPILGLLEKIEKYIILCILLIGALACAFLQALYIKQHIWLTLNLRYVDYELGQNDKTGLGLFGAQGKQVRDALYEEKSTQAISKLLAVAEGGLPSLVGGLYIVVFYLVLYITPSPDGSGIKFESVHYTVFTILGLIVFGILIFCAIVGLKVRKWNFDDGKKVRPAKRKRQKSA